MSYRVVLDFDGVLHAYRSGWTGVVPEDGPNEGAHEFVEALLHAGYELAIVSSRAKTREGYDATVWWLAENGFPAIPVYYEKKSGVAYVDDRGVHFDSERMNWSECFQRVLELTPETGGRV